MCGKTCWLVVLILAVSVAGAEPEQEPVDPRSMPSHDRQKDGFGGGLDQDADALEQQRRFSEAAAVRQQLVEALVTAHGAADWRVALAQLQLEETNRRARQSAAGLDEEEQASALDRQATDALQRGDPEQAVAPAKRALLIRWRLLGSQHFETLNSLATLAQTYADLGEHERALALEYRVARGRMRLFDKRHPDFASALNSLAARMANADEGNVEKAIQLLRQSAEICRETLGSDALGTLSVETNLARLLLRTGQLATGAEMLERALAARRRLLGPDHPDTARTLSDLAEVALQRTDLATAKSYAEEALRIQERTLGKDHPTIASSLRQLARVHVQKGEAAQAEPLLQRALDILENALGDWHPERARCQRELGKACEKLDKLSDAANYFFWSGAAHEIAGRLDEAEQAFRDLVALDKRRYGASSAAGDYARYRLAGILEKKGDPRQALDLLETNIRAAGQSSQASDRIMALEDRARLHEKLGDSRAAEADLLEGLNLAQQTGEGHREGCCLSQLISLYEQTRDLEKWDRCQTLQEDRSSRQSPDHRQTLSAAVDVFWRWNYLLSDSWRKWLASTLREEARKQLWTLRSHGRCPEAARLALRLVVLQEILYGPQSAECAAMWSELGDLCLWGGELIGASKAWPEAYRRCQQWYGEQDPRTQEARYRIEDMERWEKFSPEELQRIQLAVRVWLRSDARWNPRYFQPSPEHWPLVGCAADELRKLLGEQDPYTLDCRCCLAVALVDRGLYAQALPHLMESAAGQLKVRGPQDARTVAALRMLGLLECALGDFASAEPRLNEALAYARAAFPPDHPEIARNWAACAVLHQATGDLKQSLQCLQRARAANADNLDDGFWLTPDLDQQLGEVYYELGEYEPARRFLKKALENCVQRYGLASLRVHPIHARLEVAEWAAGERSWQQVAQQFELFHGDYTTCGSGEHIDALNVKQLQTALCLAGRQYERAAECADGACNMALTMHRRAAGGQSERQQLASAEMLRVSLDHLLSIVPEAALPDIDPYSVLLQWKGTVVVHQRRIRELRKAADSAGDGQVSAQFQRLLVLNERIAELTFAGHEAVAETLIREKESIESALSLRLAGQTRPPEAAPLTPEQLQEKLPPEAALIDLYEYRHLSPVREDRTLPAIEPRFVAFVVRRDEDIQRIDLGPSRPIAEAVTAWQRSWGRGEESGGFGDDVGASLRRLVWQPLQRSVGNAELVLVSPDGALTGLPWSAIPDEAPGRVLLEKHAFVQLPVPQLLETPPDLAEPDGAARSTALLLMGGINYDAEPPPGRPAAATPGLPPFSPFSPLPGTAREVEDLKTSYATKFPQRQVWIATESEATKTRFLELAPQSRYVHLATHGFFADVGPSDLHPNARSTQALSFSPRLARWTPGSLSCIVFAGANQGTGRVASDALLTAAEAAAIDATQMELITLSACETGLGQLAGGEGVLGLQRAFQVAGAKSVLSSLWKVDDAATQTLMADFYRNLWILGLSKAEALRRAQLAMHTRYDPQAGRPRGLDWLRPPAGRPSPFYWAGFVLSGDWR